MRDGRTNDDDERRRRTREDNATQPLDAGRLSFAICALRRCNFRNVDLKLSTMGEMSLQPIATSNKVHTSSLIL